MAFARLTALFALALASSCSPTATTTARNAPGSSPEPAPQSVARHSTALGTKLLTTDWKEADRVALGEAMQRGIALVRLTDDEISLWGACSAEGPYGRVPMAVDPVHITLSDAEEIVANLSGRDRRRQTPQTITLQPTAQLTTTRIALLRTDLAGNCEGATHFVRRAVLGTFQIDAGAPSADADTPVRIELLPIGTNTPMARPDPAAFPVIRGQVVEVPCPEGLAESGGKCGATGASDRAPKHVWACDDWAQVHGGCEAGEAACCQNSLLGRFEFWVPNASNQPTFQRTCDEGIAVGCTLAGLNLLGRASAGNADLGVARSLLLRACQGEEPFGCALLAPTYQTDPSHAAASFARACDLGLGVACERLGARYLLGVGVEANAEKGWELAHRACTAQLRRTCWLDALRDVPKTETGDACAVDADCVLTSPGRSGPCPSPEPVLYAASKRSVEEAIRAGRTARELERRLAKKHPVGKHPPPNCSAPVPPIPGAASLLPTAARCYERRCIGL